MNPLFPFKINLHLSIKANRMGVSGLYEITNEIEKAAFGLDDNSEKDGLFLFPNNVNGDTSVFISQESKYFNQLLNLFKNSIVSIAFIKDYKHFAFHVPSETLNSIEFLKGNIEITSGGFYEFYFSNLPVKVFQNPGFNSTNDLRNTDFELEINVLPGEVIFANVYFKFPPDFTRVRGIKDIGKEKPESIRRSFWYDFKYAGKCETFYESLDLGFE